MQIVSYTELKSKADLLPLMEQSFGWPFIPEDFDESIKGDPRLRGGAVGFCALDNSKVVGYVGVMDLATRTAQGKEEMVGGIYGVATLPERTRHGISTSLMKRAHEYFLEKGYQLSLLNTSPTIVAYAMYRKLGYTDATYFPSAYKIICQDKAKTRRLKVELRLDLGRMLKLFNVYTKDKTGFVVRSVAHLEAIKKNERLTAKQCLADEKGYIIFKKEQSIVRIREVAATSSDEMNRLLDAVEAEAKSLVFSRAVLDARLRQVYQQRGFALLEQGHSVMMAKPLTHEVSFSEMYGNRFYISSLDHF